MFKLWTRYFFKYGIISIVLFCQSSWAQQNMDDTNQQDGLDPTQPSQVGDVSYFGEKNGLDLNGIMYASQQHAVIINGKVLRQGEVIQGFTVKEIHVNSVLLMAKNGSFLTLTFPDIKKNHIN